MRKDTKNAIGAIILAILVITVIVDGYFDLHEVFGLHALWIAPLVLIALWQFIVLMNWLLE